MGAENALKAQDSAIAKARNQPVKVGSFPDETGSATEGNCVTARWGGEQLEVDLQS
jgi:hypothetical protein